MAALGEDSDAEQQHSLRVGDTILLYVKEVHGYVLSELSSSIHNCVAVGPGQCAIKDPCLDNVHFATFKVLTANKYKAQDRLDEIEKLIKVRETSPAEKESLLLQAKRDLANELRDNDAEQERVQGSSLVYGETIQLMHTLSKKYLCVSTTHTSRTENTNLRVELRSENFEECIFKILPRYKVRSVGDDVRYNDLVKFESVKTEGQFLHCSVKCFESIGFNVHGNCEELNLSATESAFTVIPHYRPLPQYDPKAFRGAETVRLFHREYECYIAAEGSFADPDKKVVVEDVHCRKRHSDHGILKDPSTSANTYWQFERESDPRSGEPLSWGERVRIKHLPTRQYLTVVPHNGGFVVKLKERKAFEPQQSISDPYKSFKSLGAPVTDLDTVFSLYPVIQEGDTILLESYARIKHLQTKSWLHLQKGDPYVRQNFDPDAPGLMGLEWDSAELFMLSATETMNYDDAFTLEQVDETLLDKFSYVAGIVPVLTTHIDERNVPGAPPLTSRGAYMVSSALNELTQFLVTPNPRDTKNRQKLLRNLRVLELVIKILGFFKLDAKDASEQRRICKACYLVIENYLKGDSRKNENYLARFMGFFRTQVRMGLNAEEVMVEMCEDNIAIVSRVAESELDFMIELLVETKDPRFMEVLGNLCVCDGRPIPSTQNAVLERLVYVHGKDVFFGTEVGGSDRYLDGEKGVVYFQKPGFADWQPLTNIAARDVMEDCDDADFLASQLRLFGRLCKGNNTHTINALDKELGYITFEEALACVKNESIHPKLKSQYVELMIVMFVDVGENRAVLDNLSYSFIYDDVKENPYADTGADDITALTGVQNQYFPEMREWIKDHVSMVEKKKVVASEVDDNDLLAQVLGVLALLVKYGYYDDPEDVDDVLRPLTSVLNGFNDIPFPSMEVPPEDREQQYERYMSHIKYFTNEGRYKETDENRPIFQIKERAIEVVDLFLNFRFYVRLQRFIYDFRLIKGDCEPEEPEGAGLGVGALAVSFRLGLANTSAAGLRPPPELEQLQRGSFALLRSPLLVSMARERLKFMFSKSAYFFESPDYSSKPFPDILLDLSRYDSDELVQGSLHLLNRFFSSEISLFDKAIQTQLLVTQQSKTVFKDIEEQLPILRRYMSVDVGEDERAQLIRILRTFTGMCSLEGEEQEPNQQNQKILYNFGVLSDVLNYVLHHAKDVSAQSAATPSADEPQRTISTALKRKRTVRGGMGYAPASMEAVFVESFKFLKALARKNVEVQQRLYDRMSDLLEIEVAVPYMAEVLQEVFTGGPEICLKVTEDQVERVFQLVVTGGEEGRAELIGIIQAMAKIEQLDLPVKRNQAFIIKFFSKTREKFCGHILGEGQQELRKNILNDALDSNNDLMLLLAMTDLLASCSEGENVFIESVCQTVYSLDELLEILSNPFLPPARKRPFARFLVWVYMNTGSDKFQSGAADLTSSKEMWGYMEHLAALLQGMSEVLHTVSKSEAAYLREGLSAMGRTASFSGREAQKRKSRTPKTRSKAVPFVTGEDGGVVPGLLLYFSDGVLPLLRSFFTDFFEPPEQSVDAVERRKQITVSNNILQALLQLSDILASNFSLDAQVKLYRATVVTILSGGPTKVQLECDVQAVDNFDRRTEAGKGSVSEAREEYSRVFATEIELNEVFDTFATNYQHAYQGPNTARAQIGAKYDTEYSEFEDKELTIPGDMYLPLGPSFQEHVSCFANRGTANPTLIVKPIAERLIAQLQISFSKLEEVNEVERQRQDELDIKCLQILRAIIHNETMLIDPELKERNPAGFRKRCETRLHILQNSIQGFDNAVARVVPLLSHPNDDIVREVLAFLEAIFYSGNRTVQEGMNHLFSTREERLFSTMQELLHNAAITYKERRSLLIQVDQRVSAEHRLFETFEVQRGKKPAPGRESPSAAKNGRRVTFGKGETVEIEIEVTEPGDGESIPLRSLGGSIRDDSLVIASGDEAASLLKTPPLERKGKPQRRRHSSRPGQEAIDFFRGTLGSHRGSVAGDDEYDPYSHLDQKTVQLLRFQDSHHSKLALRVLGLMCDGQYRLMQNYLREQPDNIHNINIVGEVAHFIQHFYNDIDAETMELVHLILQTLIEMCVGNYPNQAVIFNRQIIDVINRILAIDISGQRQGYTIEDSVNLKASAVELLEVMLEETNEKTKELVMEVHGGLEIPALHDTLADFYELMNDSEVKRAGFDDEAERGLFRTYHVLAHFSDYPGVPTKELEPTGEDVQKAWSFCRKRSKSIEVYYKNMDGEKILTKVHFQFDPVNELREEVIEDVKWNVNRDSPEDKQRDFLEWMIAVKRDTIHHKRLHSNWFTRLLISFPRARYYLLILLSILLNIFLLITFAVPEGRINKAENEMAEFSFREAAGGIRPDVDDWFEKYLLYILGAFHLVLTLWMLVEYFVINLPNFVLPRYFYWIPSYFGVKAPDETYSDINILGLRTLYTALFVTASVASLPLYGYFYPFCLLHIVVNNDILQRVLRSVTKNGVALLWVAALGLVVLYIYAVVSFAFLHESFLSPNNDDGTLFCDNLFECFVSTIRYGLIDNLGLIVPLVPEKFETSALRLFFDISFFIIVTTIGLNIVFGIIVDTFSELRDERFRTEEDKKAFCFICSIANHEFERRAKGFDHHVTHDHNMWDYIYYSIYLDQIDVSDHNAIEQFVSREIAAGRNEFFPLLVALALESEEDETAQQLQELKSMVRSVLDRFREEEHEKNLRDKRQEHEKWEARNRLTKQTSSFRTTSFEADPFRATSFEQDPSASP